MQMINKSKLTDKEVKYNFNTGLAGILITYNNEIFIVDHSIALDILLKKEALNLTGIMLPSVIIGYSIYEDKELSFISKIDNILDIIVETIDDFEIYYVSVLHKRVIGLDKLKLLDKEIAKLTKEDRDMNVIMEKYISS